MHFTVPHDHTYARFCLVMAYIGIKCIVCMCALNIGIKCIVCLRALNIVSNNLQCASSVL